MNEDNNGDNKPTEGDNKPSEVKEPNFPELEKEKEQPEEKKQETPQDPEMQKWIEETKDLPNAYKRLQGSRSEAEKFRKEAEEAKKAQDEFQAQVASELQALYEKDPEAAAKLFGVQAPQGASQTPTAPTVDPDEITRKVRAEIEVDNFYERNREYIQGEEDWKNIQDIALSFVGKVDASGNKYTINNALRDALILRHQELIGDKAVMNHLSSQAKRESASESGDIAGGSASNDAEVSEEEINVWREMGGEELVKKMVEKRRKQGSR